jgi:hypothetical protein
MNNFKRNIFRTVFEEITVFDPFDYMVVRFTYTKPTDGSDLDIMVYYDYTGTIYDKNAVGYGQTPDSLKIPTDLTPDTDSYLWWANDDVSAPAGECVEAVVIGLDNINTNETTIGSNISVFLRVGWFGAIGAGTVDIQLQTYFGGTMSKVGTNIINTGGVVVDTQTKTVSVTSGTGQVTEVHSDLVGSISYNKTTKVAILT